jgi:YYY domain-containing protein
MSIDCHRHVLRRTAALLLSVAAFSIVFAYFDSTIASASPIVVEQQGQEPRFQTGDASELMLDEPVAELPVVDDARWSSEWTDSTPVAVTAWVLLLIVLGFAGRPLARAVLGSFPDAGQGFARLMLLLLAGWSVWFAASFELIEFRAIWAWYAVVAAAVVGWLIASSRFAGISATPSRRAVGGAEGSFWIVFAVFLALRFFNPDSWHPIWGGEKPMEFAHINALLRTPYFPAFDPWFSDGILNYYYYGEYLVAFLIKLTGIPSEIAFNLAQPTMLGLAASGMYSLVAAVFSKLSRDRVDPLVAGGLGVLIFCLMGNLQSAWDLIRALPDRPVFTFDWTWAASRAIDGGITEFPYFTGLYADLHAHLVALPVTIAVLALGFALATSTDSVRASLPKLVGLALCLGTLSAANAWDVPVYAVAMVAAVFLWSGRFGNFLRRLGVTLLAGGATGALAYLMFRPFHERFVALFNEVDRVAAGTDLGQFSLHFGALLGILGISMGASGLLSWSPPNPRWRDISIGVFCVVVTTAVAWQVFRPQLEELSSGSTETVLISLVAAGALAMVLLRARADAYVASIAVVIGVIGTAYLVAIGWPVLGLGIVFGACGALIYFSFDERSASYFGLMLAAAGSVVAGVEVVFVVDDLATLPDWYRMNTIFKLYYQVWTLLSVLAAVSLAVLISKRSAAITTWVSTPRGFEARTEYIAAPRSTRGRAALVACAALIGLSLVYPAVATVPRLEQRFEGHPGPNTLDSLDWMRYGTIASGTGQVIRFDGDLDAIRWFQEHVEGTPVIAEASIGPYRGNGSRFSIALGLPAVLGWDRHERQQRYYPEIAQRDIDVRDLYDSGSVERKQSIIDTYGIDYIIVGDLERKSGLPTNPAELYASPEGLAALQSMVGSDLEIVFESNGTTVYRVIRDPNASSDARLDTAGA